VIYVQLMTPLIQALQAGELPNLDSLQLGQETSSGMSELFDQLLAEFKAMEKTVEIDVVVNQEVPEKPPDSTQVLNGLLDKGVALNEFLKQVNTTNVGGNLGETIAKAIAETVSSDVIALATPIASGTIESDKPKVPGMLNNNQFQPKINSKTESTVSSEITTSTKGFGPTQLAALANDNVHSDVKTPTKGTIPLEGGIPAEGVSRSASEAQKHPELALKPSQTMTSETENEARLKPNEPIVRNTIQTDTRVTPLNEADKPIADTKIVSNSQSPKAGPMESKLAEPGIPNTINQVKVDGSGESDHSKGETSKTGIGQVVSETAKKLVQKPFSNVFRPLGIPFQESIHLPNKKIDLEQIVDTKLANQAAISKPSSGEEVAKVSQLIPQSVANAESKKMTAVQKIVESDIQGKPAPLPSVSDSQKINPALLSKNSIAETPASLATQMTQPNGMAETTGNNIHFSLIPGETETGTTIKQEMQIDGRTIKVVESKVDQFGDTAVKQIRYLKDGGEQSIKIRLVPRSLGEIQIQVRASMDSIEVVMTPSLAGAREAIEMQLAGLREKLSSEGVEITQITIQPESSSTHQQRDNSFTRQGELNKNAQDGSKRENSQDKRFSESEESSQTNTNWVSQDGRLNLVV
jgi:flagellar hook-length control protein FliK